MHRRSLSLRILLILVLTLLGAALPGGAAPLKVLIVDGQNNHNWAGTTPVIQAILEETGRFTVDVATSPPKGKPMAGFRPHFADYDVVFSNYNGDSWPAETQRDLETYMQNGGGLVVYHAADNAFSKWPAWNEMIGLGGWGGRDETSGPMIRFRDGRFVRDASPGRGGTHGPQHPFQIVLRNTDHPITRGLPSKWMHVSDELYSKLRGPAKNLTILATAYADPAKRGTGEHEPMLMALTYGRGRIFHTTLGHGPDQLQCVGCITLLRRGTEWAATGKVTQTVPADFPTATTVSRRLAATADFRAIETYEIGQSREALARIEEAIRATPPATLPTIERQLLAALNAPGTGLAGKQFCCRMLRRIGTAQSVPSLAALLANPELSHPARFALQHLAAPEAGAALRRALGELKGDLRIGVIGSLGQRRDTAAVAGLTPLLRTSDTDTVRATIVALGHIATTAAAQALQEASVPTSLQATRDDAVLSCADSLLAAGRRDAALAIYRRLSAPGASTWIRIAAYRGLVRTEPETAVPHVLALLRDRDTNLRRAAATFISQLEGTALTQALGRQLSSLDPEAQVLLLQAFATRRDPTALPAVVRASTSGTTAVRVAALETLGVLGSGEQVADLARLTTAADPVGAAARQALQGLRGANVTAALQALLRPDTPPALCAHVIEACVARHETGVTPALRGLVQTGSEPVRRAGYEALGTLAGADDVPFLVTALVQAPDSTVQRTVAQTLSRVASRNEGISSEPLVRALASGRSAVKAHLVAILAVIADDQALAAVRNQLRTPDGDLRKAVIRALSAWPNDAPLEDLLGIARSEADRGQRILALRGFIELLSQPSGRSAAQTVGRLAEAYDVAQRTDEKRMVLARLPRYPGEAALDLARRAHSDPALAREAAAATKQITDLIEKQRVSARASNNSGNAKNALDGNPATRWDTGTTMKPGQWFVVDLGLEKTVAGLTLDTRNSSNDFPRGYEVYVSFGGGDWGKPVVTGKGTGPVTKIRFPKPVATRFIKIVQTGSHDSWYWSIHELTVDTQ